MTTITKVESSTSHFLRNCKIRKFDAPKGLDRWAPKLQLTTLDSSLIGDDCLEFD